MKVKKSIFLIILVLTVALSLTGCSEFLLTLGAAPTASTEGGTRLVVYRASSESSASETDSLADVIESVYDSVVEINCTSSGGASAGSGVIFASNDDADETVATEWIYVVTNHHVIDGATAITVRLRSGAEYDATLFASDEEGDVAVLGITPKTGEDFDSFTYATLPALTYEARVGDQVFVIGNPLGSLGGTVTTGIVSALDRFINVDGTAMLLMQTDASVNSGNSGGGIFNRAGELIGVINAKASGTGVEGLGFAIPIDAAMEIVEELFETGYVNRGVMGLTIASISSESDMDYYLSQYYYRNGWGNVYFIDEEEYNFWYGVFTDNRPEQYRYGLYIASTEASSEDTKAKLKKGDLIVSVNGTEVTSLVDLQKVLYGKRTGDTVNVTVYRDGAVGEAQTITLVSKSSIS